MITFNTIDELAGATLKIGTYVRTVHPTVLEYTIVSTSGVPIQGGLFAEPDFSQLESVLGNKVLLAYPGITLDTYIKSQSGFTKGGTSVFVSVGTDIKLYSGPSLPITSVSADGKINGVDVLTEYSSSGTTSDRNEVIAKGNTSVLTGESIGFITDSIMTEGSALRILNPKGGVFKRTLAQHVRVELPTSIGSVDVSFTIKLAGEVSGFIRVDGSQYDSVWQGNPAVYQSVNTDPVEVSFSGKDMYIRDSSLSGISYILVSDVVVGNGTFNDWEVWGINSTSTVPDVTWDFGIVSHNDVTHPVWDGGEVGPRDLAKASALEGIQNSFIRSYGPIDGDILRTIPSGYYEVSPSSVTNAPSDMGSSIALLEVINTTIPFKRLTQINGTNHFTWIQVDGAWVRTDITSVIESDFIVGVNNRINSTRSSISQLNTSITDNTEKYNALAVDANNLAESLTELRADVNKITGVFTTTPIRGYPWGKCDALAVSGDGKFIAIKTGANIRIYKFSYNKWAVLRNLNVGSRVSTHIDMKFNLNGDFLGLTEFNNADGAQYIFVYDLLRGYTRFTQNRTAVGRVMSNSLCGFMGHIFLCARGGEDGVARVVLEDYSTGHYAVFDNRFTAPNCYYYLGAQCTVWPTGMQTISSPSTGPAAGRYFQLTYSLDTGTSAKSRYVDSTFWKSGAAKVSDLANISGESNVTLSDGSHSVSPPDIFGDLIQTPCVSYDGRRALTVQKDRSGHYSSTLTTHLSLDDTTSYDYFHLDKSPGGDGDSRSAMNNLDGFEVFVVPTAEGFNIQHRTSPR